MQRLGCVHLFIYGTPLLPHGRPARAAAARRVGAVPLSHRALAECAALLCANSPADAARAEAALAAHQPVPQWAVEGVLLSTDLLPRLLAPLASGDGAAAAACSAWAAGWRATAWRRRKLERVPFHWSAGLFDAEDLDFATIPGDVERLMVSRHDDVSTRIFSPNMSKLEARANPPAISPDLSLIHI